MAYAIVDLKHPQSGQSRAAPVGICWPMAVLGPFPALYRRDWHHFLPFLGLAIISLGITSWILMLSYNQMYLRRALKSGYRAVYVRDKQGNALALEDIEARENLYIPIFGGSADSADFAAVYDGLDDALETGDEGGSPAQ